MLSGARVENMKITKPTAVALDFLAIAIFALLARLAHQSDDMPFNVAGWASTVWPFAIGVALGWVIVEFGLRTTEPSADTGTTKATGHGPLIWLVTVVTGLAIWGIRNQALPHWSFVIVACVMSALLMLGWRGISGVLAR